ncbi:hypothetical protein Dalk_2809 [Desulfatibacillum aliphaticivorans]|uniref:Uncharacterized protein n=1 Tax=Desulfatibacillum aliphaticivorans TaxID=218208 RepID=B8FKX8_DESAL|nr:hypothetical protein [Desulfatibacillum aliphaticivorans]ACL04500.1 hypothetical protein Dalk_2809 [Desulfatibacillum aliphaticivorans]
MQNTTESAANITLEKEKSESTQRSLSSILGDFERIAPKVQAIGGLFTCLGPDSVFSATEITGIGMLLEDLGREMSDLIGEAVRC